MNGYPKYFLWLLIATSLLLFISGVLLTPSVMIFRLELESDWLMDLPLSSGDLRLLVTVIHAIFAWLMVWLIGALWAIHMRSHWRRNENRASGAVLSAYWALLLFTGLGIYYFGGEDLSKLSSLIHTVFGLLMPLGMIIHRIKGQQSLR